MPTFVNCDKPKSNCPCDDVIPSILELAKSHEPCGSGVGCKVESVETSCQLVKQLIDGMPSVGEGVAIGVDVEAIVAGTDAVSGKIGVGKNVEVGIPVAVTANVGGG